jgi:acetylornithine deacetylase/succinyl-diaminopimelate desuccinylase-like protein
MRLGPFTRVVVSLVAIAALARISAGQHSSVVSTVLTDPRVKAALDMVRVAEPQTIEDQVRFCEVAAPPFKEAPRGDVLRRAFQGVGLRNVQVDRAGNVLGELPGTAQTPRVVIASHLDTVFPEGTALKVNRDRQGVLRGPGISDNCRGLAVLVSVARALIAANVRTGGPVTFVANVGEEGLGDLRGMKALFQDTLKNQVDRFVSIDGGGLYVTNVGVGSHRYLITFKGPGGHSFGSFGAPNPASALGRAMAKIADLQVPTAPRTTFNVGRIGGGTSVNAVPAEAWMELDLRSADAAQLAELDAKIQGIIDSALAEENRRWRAGARLTVAKQLIGDRPAGALPASASIVQTVQAAARALLGTSIPPSEGSSDANLPLSLGIPAVAIGGGGHGEDAHATSEWWDPTDSWKGTQHVLLVAVALAEP